jgi:hypothetical protein
MARQRVTMRKIRDILRLRLAGGLSIRQINASTKVSLGSIQKLLSKAAELELGWPLPDDLNDAQLARMFYPGADTRISSRFQVPDWPVLNQELKHKCMTKQLLWEEYTPISQPLLELLTVLRPLPALAWSSKTFHAPTAQSR